MNATKKRIWIPCVMFLCCMTMTGLIGCAVGNMFGVEYKPIPGDTVATIEPYNAEIANVINDLLADSNIKVVQNANKNAPNFLAEIEYNMDRYNRFVGTKDTRAYTKQGLGNSYETVLQTFNIPESMEGSFSYNIQSTFKFPNLREYESPTIKTDDPNQAVDMFCLLAAQGLQWIKDGERKRITDLNKGDTLQSVGELENRLYGTLDERREEELKPIPKRVVKEGEEPPITTPQASTRRTIQQQQPPQQTSQTTSGKTRYILMSDNSAWILHSDPEDNQLKLYQQKDWISTKEPTMTGDEVKQWFNENLQNFEGIYPYQNGSVQFGEENNLLKNMVNQVLQ